MPSPSILPPAEPDPVIGEPVGASQDHNVGAAVRDAMGQLRHRLQAEQLKLEMLRAQVDDGLDALERGGGAVTDPGDIQAIIASLTAAAGT